MPEKEPFLCDGCPGKGNPYVDFDVNGSCYFRSVDSFLQTRRYRIECPEQYSSNKELAELSSAYLRYFDEEAGEYFEEQGRIEEAYLGILCAERFLAGHCTKTRNQILKESEI